MTGSPPTLLGKTCMITGASSGLGLATARALAEMGAHTVLVCRDRGRGETALSEIVRAEVDEDLIAEHGREWMARWDREVRGKG